MNRAVLLMSLFQNRKEDRFKHIFFKVMQEKKEEKLEPVGRDTI